MKMGFGVVLLIIIIIVGWQAGRIISLEADIALLEDRVVIAEDDVYNELLKFGEHFEKELTDVARNLNLQSSFINGLVYRTNNRDIGFINRKGTIGGGKNYFPKTMQDEIPDYTDFEILEHKVESLNK